MPDATTNHIKTILEADMGNYESVMNRAKSVTDKFTSNTESKMSGFGSKLKGSFKNVGDAVSNFSSKHGASVSKIVNGAGVMSAAVLAGTGIVAKAFVGMASDAIQSAADVQVVNAQYQQVFEGIEEQAGASIDNMSKQWNIVPQRLKEPMSAFQSFFRSVGKEGPQALDATNRAMTIAADSSAFYDKSLEETQASLKGFLMGNYENGDALGVNTNLTKIATAYNDKYGGSFQDLSDAAQQDFLLEYIENVQKSSKVTGQATREQNNWSNVMGNIQSKFQTLKASLATPFLQPILDALNKLTPAFDTVGKKLEDFFASAQGQEVIKQFSDTVSVLADQLVKFISNIDIGAIADQIGKFVNSFTNGDLPGTISTIVEKIGQFMEIAGKIIPVIVKWAPTVLALAAGFKALSVISTIVSIVSGLMSILTTLGGVITTIVGVLGGPVTLAIAAVVAAGVLLYKNWDTVVQWAQKLWQWIQEAWAGIVEATVNMAAGVAQWFSDMKDKAVAKVTELVDNVVKWYNNMKDQASQAVSAMVDAVVKWWNNLKDSVVRFASNMAQAAVQKFNELKQNAINAVTALVNGVVNFFQNLLSKVQNIISNVKNAVSNGFNAVKSIATNLISNTVTAVVNIFGRIVSGISTNVNKIKTTVSNGIKGAYDAVINWGKTFYDAGANLVGMVAGGISSAVHKVTDAIGSVVGKVRDFLPFSPAKTGPLSDLDKLNFGGTISTGIYNGERQVTRAMNDILNVPDLVEPALSFGSASGPNYRYSSDVDNRLRIDLYSTTEVDGREIARTTSKDMTEEQNRANRFASRAAGYRI